MKMLSGVQMTESPNAWTISADIKGFYASDVSVTAEDDALIVEMTSKHAEQASYYLGEIEPERIARIIPLGVTLDTSSVMTHHNNGKLEILVQKAESHRQQRAATAA